MLDIYPSNNKILLIGNYPPPLGGVSVHVSRLFNLLQKNSFPVEVFDLSKYNKSKFLIYTELFTRLIFNDYDIVHVHSLALGILIVLWFIKKVKRFSLFITDHNPRFFEAKKTKIIFYKRILKKTDTLILVSKQVLEVYLSKKVTLPQNVLIRNAFLPPPLEKEDEILRSYEGKLFDFLREHKPIITCNAFEVVIYKNLDLYGIDMCVELTAKLKEKYPKVGFLFALANHTQNIAYLSEIKQRIKDLGLEENFYFLTGQKELWPLFRMTNLMIRPTITDGDALSIREALHLGCPVVASDICERPKGTLLFQSRNINDLFNKVTGCI